MYQTLYRKYRPKDFNDIVGQDIIVKVLKNSIKNNKISHAYMFIGPRGTGKTSTAKIFAKAVNCENNNQGNMCGKCSKCIVSANNDCLDIIEIDAASNNGVDEIRNLRDKVNLVPNELKYKVYIIDEVHMLTIQAFNALLKTLEEPPEHIIFILATTDPQKIPETIISRCQCFNFCRINEKSIVDNLKMISNKEKIDVEDEVLSQIALLSDGGMRDSIGMLDKLSTYSDKKITLEDFIKLNGLVTTDNLNEITSCILDGNINKTIEILENWNDLGNNMVQILIQLLDYLKNRLIDEYINNKSDNNTKKCQDLANLINEKLVEIRQSSNPRVYIEIMLLSFISKNNKIEDKIISQEIIDENKTNKEEKNTETVEKEQQNDKNNELELENIKKSTETVEKEKSNISKIMKVRVNNTFVNATKTQLNSIQKQFKKLEDYTFDLDIGYLACALLDGTIRLASDSNIVISFEYPSAVQENLNNISKMEKLLTEKCEISSKLAFITDDEWKKYAEEFMNKKKSGEKYEFISEPELLFDTDKKKAKIANKSGILDEFSDILELG